MADAMHTVDPGRPIRSIRGRASVRPGFGSMSDKSWPSEALPLLTKDVATFARRVWGRDVELSSEAAPLTDRLSIENVADMIADGGLRLPDVRMMRDGEPISEELFTSVAQLGRRSVSGLIDVNKTLELIANGATLILQGSRRYCSEVDSFCRKLDLELGQTTQAGFFLTPSNSVGAPFHYDFFDAFICQIEGTKKWQISGVPDYVPGQAWSPGQVPEGKEFQSLTLKPGDCLYLPRGTYHEGKTGRAPSLHLTIRVVQPYTYRTVLELLIDDLVPGFDLDKPLPIGYRAKPEIVIRQLTPTLSAITPEQVRQSIASALYAVNCDAYEEIAQPFEGRTRLREAVTAPLISELTQLAVCRGADCLTYSEGLLSFGDEKYAVSRDLGEAIVPTLQGQSFRPSDIWNRDHAAVVALCRWLNLVGAVEVLSDEDALAND